MLCSLEESVEAHYQRVAPLESDLHISPEACHFLNKFSAQLHNSPIGSKIYVKSHNLSVLQNKIELQYLLIVEYHVDLLLTIRLLSSQTCVIDAICQINGYLNPSTDNVQAKHGFYPNSAILSQAIKGFKVIDHRPLRSYLHYRGVFSRWHQANGTVRTIFHQFVQ